eukprot:TRINITY_DN1589_c0_g5_i1.p1 TRINITY_DN1589_c0_g5~~TRINITY_DN1589_c0_g5_i1.p1  ORF type:complete len:303 (-),score=-14.42 TRINITY_DN1589_c0_g5_i1:882-1790(-)
MGNVVGAIAGTAVGTVVGGPAGAVAGFTAGAVQGMGREVAGAGIVNDALRETHYGKCSIGSWANSNREIKVTKFEIVSCPICFSASRFFGPLLAPDLVARLGHAEHWFIVLTCEDNTYISIQIEFSGNVILEAYYSRSGALESGRECAGGPNMSLAEYQVEKSYLPKRTVGEIVDYVKYNVSCSYNFYSHNCKDVANQIYEWIQHLLQSLFSSLFLFCTYRADSYEGLAFDGIILLQHFDKDRLSDKGLRIYTPVLQSLIGFLISPKSNDLSSNQFTILQQRQVSKIIQFLQFQMQKKQTQF